MNKKNIRAGELKKKTDRLTQPEKELVLAFIKGMEAGAALKDNRPDAREARNP